MKTNPTTLDSCLLIFCLLASFSTLAQQPLIEKPAGSAKQMPGANAPGNFTYRVFQAPNKMFGYDIFQNGKGVFHQPAAVIQTRNIPANEQAVPQHLPILNDQPTAFIALSQSEFAENAALLSIEKIKKKLAPALTSEEMKQAAANKIPVIAK